MIKGEFINVDMSIAKNVGLNGYIVYKYVIDHINNSEGAWVRMSAYSISESLRHLDYRQVSRALTRLVNEEYLKSDKFRHGGRLDNTWSYCLTTRRGPL